LREDYLSEFLTWKQKADVRVLLIDPEYPNGEVPYAHQRDVEEADASGTIKQQVRLFVSDTKGITTASGSHTFEIRLYKCLPSINIFRVDNEMFWGPYLVKQPSCNSPTFLIRKAVLFDRLVEHFEHIWKDDSLSRAIPDDW
jgi:hypothetical protein